MKVAVTDGGSAKELGPEMEVPGGEGGEERAIVTAIGTLETEISMAILIRRRRSFRTRWRALPRKCESSRKRKSYACNLMHIDCRHT
ncbi:hypothetical protein T03_14990 [Trichinella britovi]|uniref:Uncharacterized protein n=1 Tax=Trichinella britovi TaxID=45882 RepID=A0A0V1DCM7_TRIBR|nr:hypothetical protein T03_14990 [Trichinella britovi]